MTALTVVFFLALAGAVASCATAIVRPSVRPLALVAAAVCFLVAGVLGILSIGVLFIAAAAVCAWLAVRTRPRTTLG